MKANIGILVVAHWMASTRRRTSRVQLGIEFLFDSFEFEIQVDGLVHMSRSAFCGSLVTSECE